MILTAHLLTGAVLATRIKFLPLSLLFAFLSHYLLDFLPHQEYSIENIRQRRWKKSFFDFLKVALDISFGILIIALFKEQFLSFAPLETQFLTGFAGGFFAILPDGLILLSLIFPKIKFLKKYYNFHSEKIHFFEKEKIPLSWGVFSQALIIFVAIFFLISK